MMDLIEYTVRDFCNMIREDAEIISEMLINNKHLSYVNKPYEGVQELVEKSTIKEENKKIVCDYIYTNLFNRYDHRFYDTKGYSTVSN